MIGIFVQIMNKHELYQLMIEADVVDYDQDDIVLQ